MNEEFIKQLWLSDISILAHDHNKLAQVIFDHAVKLLGSQPFQRRSSRERKSDGQTIFRTKLHRSFWLVLDTKSGGLQLHFPDKSDCIDSEGIFLIEHAPGTQGTRKKEKRISITSPFPKEATKQCISLVEKIHSACVEYYSRGKDYSETLKILFGFPNGKGTPLEVPKEIEFSTLLSRSPICCECGTNGLRLSSF